MSTLPSRPAGLTFADVLVLARALPEVAEGTSYGAPALQVGGKTFARLWEDGTTLVLKVPFVVRDHLLATAPDACFVTDHYRGYPAVLVRLAAADRAQVAALLDEAWRQVAPKRLVRAYDARPRGRMSGRPGSARVWSNVGSPTRDATSTPDAPLRRPRGAPRGL